MCCSVECDQLGNARSNSFVYEVPAVDPSSSFVPTISDTRREGVGGLRLGLCVCVCWGGGAEYYPIVHDAKTANDADYSSLHPMEKRLENGQQID